MRRGNVIPCPYLHVCSLSAVPAWHSSGLTCLLQSQNQRICRVWRDPQGPLSPVPQEFLKWASSWSWPGLGWDPRSVRQAPMPPWELGRKKYLYAAAKNAVPWICSDAEVLDPFRRLHRNQSLSWESKKTLSWEYSISAPKTVHYTQKKMQSLSSGMYLSSVSEQYQHTLHQATPQACSAISWVYS